MSSINDQKELRIVLVGKTGCGKSSLGNNLLLDTCFESSSICASVTSSCKLGETKMINGTKLGIVDTPGLFDTSKTAAETQHELVRCITLSSPGPHVFIFVLKVGRGTDEELHTIDRLIEIFGDEVLKHVIIVFTEKDKLEYDKITIDDYINQVPKGLSDLLRRCDYRYAAINNRDKGDGLKDDVMRLVQDTLRENGDTHYTSEMYEKAEAIMKKKIAVKEEEKAGQIQVLQKKMAEIEAREEKNKEDVLEKMREQLLIVNKRDARSEVKTEIASSAMDMIMSFFHDFVPLICKAVVEHNKMN